MARINVLPKNIADLIAAGEVVERPSSVIKEFTENSIDAGAKKITVEINNGGKSYIRVTDDGCGILREDVKNAFVSHATSKIKEASDLDAIYTLGFRGEALASVSAVSRVELITRASEESVGTRYIIEGGEEKLLDDAGCPVGTTLIVRDIFFNTPARLKFLKKDVQEGNYISSVIERIAVSHADISFRLIRDGKTVFFTSGNGGTRSAIYSVFGRSFTEDLLPVESENSGVSVKGFCSKPISGRGSRSMQMFFVNGRYVKSTLFLSALEAAYKNSIMVGKFPACVLFISLPAETVDVNVHPAKTEVRIFDERRVFDVIYGAVFNAINTDTSRPQASFNPATIYAPVKETGEQLDISSVSVNNDIAEKSPEPRDYSFKISEFGTTRSSGTVLHSKDDNEEKTIDFLKGSYKEPVVKTVTVTVGGAQNAPVEPSEIIDQPTYSEVFPTKETAPVAARERVQEKVVQVKYIGEAFKTYLFAEVENKLVMIDKHAAHERILFEKFKRERKASAQFMLSPVAVQLSADEYSAILENSELLSDAGYEVCDFGSSTVKISACPSDLVNENMQEVISEIASYLANHIKTVMPEKLDWIYHSMACRTAIKAGNFTSSYEAELFVKDLLKRDDVRYCPHGRPVLVEISRTELEKQFKRIV